jgi:hypothetical protein
MASYRYIIQKINNHFKQVLTHLRLQNTRNIYQTNASKMRRGENIPCSRRSIDQIQLSKVKGGRNERRLGHGNLGMGFESEVGAMNLGSEVGTKICGSNLGARICGTDIPTTLAPLDALLFLARHLGAKTYGTETCYLSAVGHNINPRVLRSVYIAQG